MNTLTDTERAHIQCVNRGRLLGPGMWRNFCSRLTCGKPLEVTHEWLKDKTDLVCDDCRPAIQTCNVMSNAFSPEARNRSK